MILENPQDYLIGVTINPKGGQRDELSHNWARWKVDADLSGISDVAIKNINQKYNAQTGQLRDRGNTNNYESDEWYALAESRDEMEVLRNDLSKFDVDPDIQEISPPESVLTTAAEECVKDKAALEFHLG